MPQCVALCPEGVDDFFTQSSKLLLYATENPERSGKALVRERRAAERFAADTAAVESESTGDGG
jgi:hypothetical protein